MEKVKPMKTKRTIKTTFLLFALIAPANSQPMSYAYNTGGNHLNRTTIVLESSGQKARKTDNPAIKVNSPPVTEEKFGNQRVRIYPNPTAGILSVDIQGFEEGMKSSIYLCNLSGLLLIGKSPVSANNILDMSTLQTGTYVLKVTLGNKINEWKVVKK
jgi:hypothetical protein